MRQPHTRYNGYYSKGERKEREREGEGGEEGVGEGRRGEEKGGVQKNKNSPAILEKE